MKKIGIFVYEGVEPIEMAIFGTFSMAKRVVSDLEMFLVSQDSGDVILANGLVVKAHHSFSSCPPIDALIICGGPGWTKQVNNPEALQFIEAHRKTLTASVCTGAMIFAATGLLDGKVATTKASYADGEADPFEVFRERFPKVELSRAGIVDLGNQMTGGGVSLCIDATLHVLAKLYDEETADKVARVICYDVARAANMRERGIQVATS
jgi:transcriptional regulator GlxA family with amidase domain